MPVYPGTKPVNIKPPFEPRIDGSYGQFDWTLIPQHLNTNLLHHAFILDPKRLKDGLVDYIPLTRQWESLSLGTGHLQLLFVTSLIAQAEKLERRHLQMLDTLPSALHKIGSLVSCAPTTLDIRQFDGEITWDEGVEGVVEIQRVMREKEGWLRMMDVLHSTAWSMEVSLVSPPAAVQERYLGVWVNGVDERAVRWLLHVGVPCFIIHKYREGLDFGPGIVGPD